MQIYFCFIIFIWLFLAISRNFKHTVFYIVFIIATLFAGLRYQTGYDWPVYELFYQSIRDRSLFSIIFEPGFQVLGYLAVFLNLDFNYFILFISMLQMGILARSTLYLNIKLALLVMIFYLSIVDLYLIHSFSIVRQGLALSVFWLFLSMQFKGKRNCKWLLLLAPTFQASSLIATLVYVVIELFSKRKYAYVSMLLAGLINYIFGFAILSKIITLLSSIILGEYAHYINKDIFQASLVYKISAVLVIFFIILTIYRVDLKKKILLQYFPDLDIIRVIRLSYSIPVIYLFTYDMPTISTRVISMLGLSVLIVLSLCIYSFRRWFRYCYMCLLFLFFLVVNYRFLSNPLTQVYIPYQTYIFEKHVNNSDAGYRTMKLHEDLQYMWSK